MAETKVSPEELYRFRLAQLEAERKALQAQLAQSEARAILLEIEKKYGLLATEATLDISTGRITHAPTNGKAD